MFAQAAPFAEKNRTRLRGGACRSGSEYGPQPRALGAHLVTASPAMTICIVGFGFSAFM